MKTPCRFFAGDGHTFHRRHPTRQLPSICLQPPCRHRHCPPRPEARVQRSRVSLHRSKLYRPPTPLIHNTCLGRQFHRWPQLGRPGGTHKLCPDVAGPSAQNTVHLERNIYQ
jgi:hypothetical protein